jgi:hypothetical protein
MEKTYIENSRVIEFISETVDRLVKERFRDKHMVLIDDELCYTEEAQDYFNEQYDLIESDLNNTLGVYSDNENI